MGEYELYTGVGAAVGPGVRVVPPGGWSARPGGGRPRAGSGGWSVGGRVYRTWAEAWRGAVGGRGGRPPTAASYFGVADGGWSVAERLEELRELVAPRPGVGSGPQLGIDLSVRGVEVRRLLYSKFSIRIARAGYDPEDVLQEVYRALLVRNGGKCPFDVRKSSFGHYVMMVISCVLANYHRRESRRTVECSWEDLPPGCGVVDRVGAGAHWGVDTEATALEAVCRRVRECGVLSVEERELALRVLPLVHAGYAPTVRGAREAGWPEAEWRRAVVALRRALS